MQCVGAPVWWRGGSGGSAEAAARLVGGARLPFGMASKTVDWSYASHEGAFSSSASRSPSSTKLVDEYSCFVPGNHSSLPVATQLRLSSAAGGYLAVGWS